jgi:hypothetical protein
MLSVFIAIKREIHKLLMHVWITIHLNYRGLNVTVSIFEKVFSLQYVALIYSHSHSQLHGDANELTLVCITTEIDSLWVNRNILV